MRTIDGQTITDLANAAFKKAAEEVITTAIRSNTPIIIWQDGAIKEIQATPGMTLESFTALVDSRAS
jgi:hypothetical protein